MTLVALIISTARGESACMRAMTTCGEGIGSYNNIWTEFVLKASY